MKKLLLITQYFPPEIGGGSQRSFGFAKELSDLGVDVTVVTPYPTYLMKKEEVKTKFKLYEKVEQDGITVYQTFVIATDRGGFFRRILYYLSFTVSAIIVPRALFSGSLNFFSSASLKASANCQFSSLSNTFLRGIKTN